MTLRWKMARIGVLAALISLTGVLPVSAAAVIEPDPEQEPAPALITSGCLAVGTATIFPGGPAFCWCVFRVPASIRYHADVLPNKGAPSAKINIWRWDTSGNNPILVFRARRTGLNAVDETFTTPGFYGMCAKYPLGQQVDGTDKDFINVTENVG